MSTTVSKMATDRDVAVLLRHIDLSQLPGHIGDHHIPGPDGSAISASWMPASAGDRFDGRWSSLGVAVQGARGHGVTAGYAL